MCLVPRLALFPAILALAFTAYFVDASARTYRTVPKDGKNVVQFVSDATLERIVGRTSSLSGSADLDLANIKAISKASFEVDLRTIDTGIAMRNQDMRTNYFETDKFPKATFVLHRVVSSDTTVLTPERPVNMVVEGEFTVRGVSKTYQIPVTLRYTPGEANSEVGQRLYGSPGALVNVTAEWSVRLSDHGIIRPAFLFMRLAEEQKVSIAFALTDVLPKR